MIPGSPQIGLLFIRASRCVTRMKALRRVMLCGMAGYQQVYETGAAAGTTTEALLAMASTMLEGWKKRNACYERTVEIALACVS